MPQVTEIKGGGDLTQTSPFPLTTKFTPDSSCVNATAYDLTYISGHSALQLNVDPENESCYPSGYHTIQRDGDTWYSPGVCPNSYVYVETSVATHGDAPATTFAVCCPAGVWHAQSAKGMCFQKLTEGFLGNVYFSSMMGSTAYAYPISVAWQESDLSLFMPRSAPVVDLAKTGVTFPTRYSIPSTTSSKPFSSSTGVQDQDNGDKPDSGGGGGGGLPTGAAIGIGVGVGIAVMIAIAAIWMFTKRYKSSGREMMLEGAASRGINRSIRCPVPQHSLMRYMDTH